jgi:hypothetical protein
VIFKAEKIVRWDWNNLTAEGNAQIMWQDPAPDQVTEVFQCQVPAEADHLKWVLENSLWVAPGQWVFNKAGIIKSHANIELCGKFNIKMIDVQVGLTPKNCIIELIVDQAIHIAAHCHHISQIDCGGPDWGSLTDDQKRACMVVAAKFFFDKAEKEFTMPGRASADDN